MKLQETLDLERGIWKATKKQGVFGCFEVTIGWFGKERVDYMTYDTKGIWRCFEIKVSKSDFRSKAHNTFIGHFNYYVMPRKLYEQVEKEIPDGIGVYVGGACVKKPKKRELGVDEQVLKDSMIRSLSRDVDKQIKSEDKHLVDALNREIGRYRREKEDWYKKYWRLLRKVEEKFGVDWEREK